jgi:hypothetical protein
MILKRKESDRGLKPVFLQLIQKLKYFSSLIADI